MKVVPVPIPTTNDVIVHEFIAKSSYDITSHPLVVDRVRIAIDFYLTSNDPIPTKDQIFSEIAGIDFLKPIEIVELEENDLLDQIQTSEFGACVGRKGKYFSIYDPIRCATASERGISEDSMDSLQLIEEHLATTGHDRYFFAKPKKQTIYLVSKSSLALMSTSKPIEDSWSMHIPCGGQNPTPSPAIDTLEGKICVPTSGGAIQIYTGSKGNQNILCHHALQCKETINDLRVGKRLLTSLKEDELSILANHIAILNNVAQYALTRGDSQTHLRIKTEFKELLTIINDAEKQAKSMNGLSGSLLRFLERVLPKSRSTTPPLPTTSSKDLSSLTPCFDLSFRMPPSHSFSPNSGTPPRRRSSVSSFLSYVSASVSHSTPPSRSTSPTNSDPPSRSTSPTNSAPPSRRSSFPSLLSYVSSSFSNSNPPSRRNSFTSDASVKEVREMLEQAKSSLPASPPHTT